MVLLATNTSSTTYEMFNDKAEPLGEIRLPVTQGLLGFGRETVYLDRGPHLPHRFSSSSAA